GMERGKGRATMPGWRLVSTTIPPSRAWATMPAGWTAASQTRSRRLRPPGRNRHAAMNTTRAISVMATVTSRLPNSIQVWNIGSPAVCAATRLPRVHCGQSGHPRPDSLSRTAAPVAMIPAVQITPARARMRIAAGGGARTAPAPGPAGVRGPGPALAGGGGSSAGQDPREWGWGGGWGRSTGVGGAGRAGGGGRGGSSGTDPWQGGGGGGGGTSRGWGGGVRDQQRVGRRGERPAARYASGIGGSLAPRAAPAQAI